MEALYSTGVLCLPARLDLVLLANFGVTSTVNVWFYMVNVEKFCAIQEYSSSWHAGRSVAIGRGVCDLYPIGRNIVQAVSRLINVGCVELAIGVGIIETSPARLPIVTPSCSRGPRMVVRPGIPLIVCKQD